MYRSVVDRLISGTSRHLSPRVGAVSMAILAVTLTLAACEKTVTHEPMTGYSTTSDTAPSAKFEYPNPPGGESVTAYQGSGKARASFDSDAGSASGSHAYGELDAENLNFSGTYGAAVYLEPGTVAGPNPKQEGTIDLMRWRDGSNWGGIRIGSDHKGHLVDSSGSDVEPNREFAFQEGCWNWLVVHQMLRSNQADQPRNQVFLNGEKVLDSTKVNTTAPIAGGVDQVQFGLVQMGAQQDQDLNVFLDDSFISTETAPKPMVTSSAAKLCRPLPNVLFIVTDDHRADTLIGDNNAVAEFAMPKTRDWFRDGAPGVTGGTEFENAFATTPLCCPSRASIMTGQYAHHHGKQTNGGGDLGAFASNKLQYSLQRYLRDWWGYRTGLFGKFLNNWTRTYDLRYPDTAPPDIYFDEYQVFDGQYNAGGATFDPVTGKRECTGKRTQQEPTIHNSSHSCVMANPAVDGLSMFEQKEYTTRYFGAEANKFIIRQDETNDAKPWFLYVAPWAPHEEASPGAHGPEAYSNMTNSRNGIPGTGSNYAGTAVPPFSPGPGSVEQDRFDKPPWVRVWNEGRQIFQNPAATVTGLREQQIRVLRDLDDMVNSLFETLELKEEADNTIAVFIGDNGYMWREHTPAARGPDGIPTECHDLIYTTPTTSPLPEGHEVPCGPSSKGRPYRESIQVPLYIRWPKGLSQPDSPYSLPSKDSRLVANIDLLPTVLDAVGGLNLPLQEPFDGRSVLQPGQRSELLTEGWAAPSWASLVRQNGYQYIFTDDTDPNTITPNWEELYLNWKPPGSSPPGDGQNTNLYGSNGMRDDAEPPRPFDDFSDLDALRDCVGSACP
jgi:arylsulfatase A-like enzyme